MFRQNLIESLFTLLMLSLAVPGVVQGAEDDALMKAMDNPDAAERCISLHQIDHTRILDNSNILFYEHGDRIYLNHLAHRCPGLKSAGTYMYRTSIDRLCNVDFITVLNQVGGSFMPGAGCGLGLFYPIDKDVAKALIERSK